MNIKHETYSLKSNTGIANLFIQSVLPENNENVDKVLLIVHGMAEHSDRYIEVAEYICDSGIPVFMYDHAGHGRSVNSKTDLGYFGEKDGNEKIVDDTAAVAEFVKSKYPGAKLIVWGHSMGSFVTRRFAAKYPDIADAYVICGTAGANPAASIGATIANLIGKVKGSHYRSEFINNLAFGSYNKKFNGDTGFEWLSVNEENVKKYVKDDLCGYLFTAYAYRDMFRLLVSVSKDDAFTSVPSDKPIFLIAGTDDPVGNYGKGVEEVYNRYKSTGHKNICPKLYNGLRHEIHNEESRKEIYDDILTYIQKL